MPGVTITVTDVQPFPDYLQSRATASPPYLSTDYVPFVRDGQSYAIPADVIAITTLENVSQPDAINNLGIGPESIDSLPPEHLPIRIETSEPAPPYDITPGLSAAFSLKHNTNGTPAQRPLFGAVFRATQDVTSDNLSAGQQSYVGAAFVGEMSASEGGYHSTLAIPAAALDTTLTLVDASSFQENHGIHITADNGIDYAMTVVGAPEGNVITITPALPSDASAGNLVYRWRGIAKGVNVEGTINSGASGVFAGSLEVSMSAKAGSQPYMKGMLGITANANDVVQALSVYDSMLYFSRQVGSVGYEQGISFDNRSGNYPVTATGTLIRSSGGVHANGIDLSSSIFSGYALKMRGFTIDNNGRTTITSGAPRIVMSESGRAQNTGGLWSAILSNDGTTDSLTFQYNTAAGADFSSSANVLQLLYGGAVRMPALPTAGAAVGVVCINASGALFVGSGYWTISHGLTATGTTQADALVLTSRTNIVTVAPSSAVGVALPSPNVIGAGNWVDVYNDGTGNSFHVYANDASHTIDGLSGTTGVVLSSGFWCRYIATSTTTYKSYRSPITRSA